MSGPKVSTREYNAEQLQAYLNRIKMPAERCVLDVRPLSEPDKLDYLTLLNKHHLVKVPWENLTMHYSWHHIVHVHPVHLFNKIVKDPFQSRGGYCFEANLMLSFVLQSLGFDAYLAGSRICNQQTQRFGGFSHIVVMVMIGAVRYAVDGGFGPNGIIYPIPLEHGKEHAHLGSARKRLMHEPIPQNRDQSQRLWLYQHRISDDHEWKTLFCFTDLEFLVEDIERLNIGVSNWRHTFFAHKVVLARFTTSSEKLGEEGRLGTASEADLEGEIDGAIALNHSRLFWRRNGKKVVDIELKTEKDRMAVLKQYFGIVLDDVEMASIINTGAELSDVPFAI